DSVGHYVNEVILIGEDYTITVRAQGYNDSSRTGYEIIEDEILTVNFALLHPEFNNRPDGFSFIMLPDSTTDVILSLTNDGNGTLGYTSRYVYVVEDSGRLARDDPDEAFDRLLYWTPTESDSVDDYRIDGTAYIDGQWYISGSAGGEDVNYFYIFDRWGNYVERKVQPIESRYGIRDMDYHNGYIYGAPNLGFILKVDPETCEEISRYTSSELSRIRNVTVVNDSMMYISGATTDLYLVKIESDSFLIEQRSYRIIDPRTESTEVHIYGLSWFRDDPDGYNLYIMSNDEPELNDQAPDIAIFKMNPDDGDVRYLTNLSYLNPTHAAMGGMFITPKWNNLVWVFATVFNNPAGDEVGVFELAPNSAWIDYNPRADTLVSGEAIEITLDITSEGLEVDTFGVVIEFSHNAGDGTTLVPVWLYVVDSLPPPPAVNEDDLLPFEYSLSQNHPNPFNPTTRINYSLREPGITRLILFDLLGREVAVLVNEYQPAGKYQLSLDAGNLSTGLYFYRIESGDFKAIKKMVLVK
ncbi:MAG: T9SS type A sorting domain-containing protein, partial [Calditrichaeota bacterium]|nr:T9SS type A sorting domain-containing protein [Calditrichota bacterium]